ncbi:uncharacterized protein DUF721 [Chitinophaga japonensis]|uniref:Uncharacterized protein DUF721 n=2 Tax=Chitinophaga japonensis TaxID=104662 RepID=A0A562SNV7_CHIJA|nr:uncharacterized protein DUF721 [Chitinophaga japonensis]
MLYLCCMRHGISSIGDALREYMNKSRLKPRMMEVRIQENWEQLMGKTIARYTESIQLIDGKLIITTNVAPLKQELNYAKEKIIKLVNEMLEEPAVREVIVR